MRVKVLLLLAIFILLVGCSTFVKTSPTPLPTVVLHSSNATPSASTQALEGGVTASGVVVSAQKAQIALASGGRVETVDVSVGDKVQTGQALVQLEGKEAMQAAVSAAQFELDQAQLALEDLTKQTETDRIQAMQDIVTFERAVRDAQYALDNFTIPTNQVNLDAVTALNKMKERLDQARAAFEPYKYVSLDNSTREDLKEALDQAQADYNAAVRRLQLEYDFEVSVSQLTKAQQDYEILKEGADPDKVRLAESRQSNAQAHLEAAQAALEKLTLTAPFMSTVCEVNVHSGEWGISGQPILVLADLEHLRIETTDLSERDVPKISIGQPVTVYIKSLNLDVAGKVSEIAPLASTLGGDVVYKITIDLNTIPTSLREGMSVEVLFGTAT